MGLHEETLIQGEKVGNGTLSESYRTERQGDRKRDTGERNKRVVDHSGFARSPPEKPTQLTHSMKKRLLEEAGTFRE